MRVITGSAKSIPLISLDPKTRPLSDRAKTALFEIISSKIIGSSVLDLYSGSGALGIECLSRGANFAEFIDISKKSIESINTNLKKTRLEDRGEVIKSDVERFLKGNEAKYDIIFVCPPYNNVKLHIVKLASQLLNNNGILIFEHHKKDKFKELENLKKIDERKYGIVDFEIYMKY